MYTRDPNGNPTGIDVSGPAGVIVTESMRNTYDNADRLTKTCFTTTTCTTANQTVWSYNQVGSRLTEKIGTAAVSTYTYDIADQLTAITGPGATSFTYNANGDQLTAGTDTFTYNTARQTVSATVAGVTSQYAYDGNGNRHTVTTGGVATREVWDTVGGLPTLVAQRNNAGVVQRRYTYAGATPIKYEDITGANTGYYQTDGIGSITNLTSPTGTIGATYRYNPYGTQRAATTVLPAYAANPLKYTGQQQDPTGNYNLRARHYNPSRGQFTQTDPTPLGAGSPFEGTYVYARSRPAVMIDPSGKRSAVLNQENTLQTAEPKVEVQGSVCVKYDRRAAVDYAKKYALKPNDAQYHVYINDCTNFMSQILRAGGWESTKAWNSKTPAFSLHRTYDSTAWTTASAFWDTWANSQRARATDRNGVGLGDLIGGDLHGTGQPTHFWFVTGVRGNDLLVSAHTNYRLDDSFAMIQQANPNAGYYFLHINDAYCEKGDGGSSS